MLIRPEKQPENPRSTTYLTQTQQNSPPPIGVISDILQDDGTDDTEIVVIDPPSPVLTLPDLQSLTTLPKFIYVGLSLPIVMWNVLTVSKVMKNSKITCYATMEGKDMFIVNFVIQLS